MLDSMNSTSPASMLSMLTPSEKPMGVVLVMSEVSATRSGEGLEFNSLRRAVVLMVRMSSCGAKILARGLRLWMGLGILIELLAFGVARRVAEGVTGDGARREDARFELKYSPYVCGMDEHEWKLEYIYSLSGHHG